MARRFGVLTHRKGGSKRGERDFGVRVHVFRNVGASRARQFCGSAYVPKSGRARRGLGFRQSDSVCAPTPTKVAKLALRALAKEL